jgi:hypothetical protein
MDKSLFQMDGSLEFSPHVAESPTFEQPDLPSLQLAYSGGGLGDTTL